MTPDQWQLTGLLLLIPTGALFIFIAVVYWKYEVITRIYF